MFLKFLFWLLCWRYNPIAVWFVHYRVGGLVTLTNTVDITLLEYSNTQNV